MTGSLSVESSKKAADRRFYAFIILLVVVLTPCRYGILCIRPMRPNLSRRPGSIHIFFLSLGLCQIMDPVLHWIHSH